VLRAYRTCNTQDDVVIEADVVDVVAELGEGLSVVISDDRAMFHVGNGEGATRQIDIRRSLTPSTASRLVASRLNASMVIADLIDSEATRVLERAGWSYWDRRGRLRLWLPEIGYRMDVPTRAFVTGADGPARLRPITGVGGLSAALGVLIDSTKGVRAIAREASVTGSTISRARQILIDASLISPGGAPLVPELFWALSDAWVPKAVVVEARPSGGDWVLGGDAAAAHWGAPVFANRERYYCESRRTFDTFVHLHRADGDTGVEVAVAPTPMVWTTADDGVVDPVVAALDLSRSARGRDILEEWTSIDLAGNPVHRRVVWQ
jgi:hypothetical protein